MDSPVLTVLLVLTLAGFSIWLGRLVERHWYGRSWRRGWERGFRGGWQYATHQHRIQTPMTVRQPPFPPRLYGRPIINGRHPQT